MTQPSRGLRKHRVACFISPHGFGHAARSASVMEALFKMETAVHFDIFTTVPSWFFEDSLSAPFTHHRLFTDIGMVQQSPFQEDLEKTVAQLNDFLPLAPSLINQLAQRLDELQCELALCDIAPMAILAAKEAAIPSVLVENFTWDWIYQGYADRDKEMGRHIAYLQSVYALADHHIQTEPVCCHRHADLLTPPVSREPRTPRETIRKRLRLSLDKEVVLITMGGIEERYRSIRELTGQPHVTFLIPGGSQAVASVDNLVLFPHHSDFYHPDLVHASDAVIGKLGYSTLAEVYHAGVPFGYIARPCFPESEPLADYVLRRMPAKAVEEQDFLSGRWLSQLKDILSFERVRRKGPNGSKEIASYVCALLSDKKAGA
ncbi:MAG: hypothetical protein SWE60_14430 [Thermodesulfobacteriota bacterium]|nr:hypothetical protein [Thermodesulfobacteriota bacterium]